ncbi:protein of unknown function [Candidatus Filomicrobium marinum]|nr:protein of unknown function [Candidatus Filomicrobium marinum]
MLLFSKQAGCGSAARSHCVIFLAPFILLAADFSRAAATGEVHVEMIVVIAVVVGPEHCCETLAGALMYNAKEISFVRSPSPATRDADGTAIGKLEARYIQSVGVAVF